jgi:hypothetical protein
MVAGEIRRPVHAAAAGPMSSMRHCRVDTGKFMAFVQNADESAWYRSDNSFGNYFPHVAGQRSALSNTVQGVV